VFFLQAPAPAKKPAKRYKGFAGTDAATACCLCQSALSFSSSFSSSLSAAGLFSPSVPSFRQQGCVVVESLHQAIGPFDETIPCGKRFRFSGLRVAAGSPPAAARGRLSEICCCII
jgi:hypothetical protein